MAIETHSTAMLTDNHDMVRPTGPALLIGIFPASTGADDPPRRVDPSTKGADDPSPSVTPSEDTARAARARVASDLAAGHRQRIVNASVDGAADGPPPRAAFQTGHAAGQWVYEHGRGAMDLAYAEASRRAQQGRPVPPGGRMTVRHQGRDIEYRDVMYRPYNDGYAASFRVEDGETDMRYDMSDRGGRFSATGRGVIAHDGETFQVDLTYRGSRNRQLDTSGSSTGEQYAVTGSVQTDDWRLTLNETYRLQTETGDVRTVGHGSACVVTRTINNSLQLGDDLFRWRGVHTRASFRSNRRGPLEASSPTEWAAEGRVTRNGQPYAQYALERQDQQLRIHLQTPTESVTLDSYTLPR